jgi:hypothetical protein
MNLLIVQKYGNVSKLVMIAFCLISRLKINKVKIKFIDSKSG